MFNSIALFHDVDESLDDIIESWTKPATGDDADSCCGGIVEYFFSRASFFKGWDLTVSFELTVQVFDLTCERNSFIIYKNLVFDWIVVLPLTKLLYLKIKIIRVV